MCFSRRSWSGDLPCSGPLVPAAANQRRKSNNIMKILCSLFAITALTLSGCDSRQENQRENALEKKADGLENQADAVRKDSEKKADAIESSGKQGADKLNP